ncbi:MAG: hypothetical protein M3Q65_17030 [Chloroflexota bacterium]|nr:hypothetical protein [Chloroflexota bacterium]
MVAKEPALIADEDVRRVQEAQRRQAELASLTEQLHGWATLRQQLEDAGEEPQAYLRRLTARRTELLQRLSAEQAGATDAEEEPPHDGDQSASLASSDGGAALTTFSHRPGGLLEQILTTVNDVFGRWRVLSVPRMRDGFAEVPDVPGTRGQIITTGLYPGGVTFTDDAPLADDGVQNPLVEKWWVRTWQCALTFPAAAELSRLSYRFIVRGDVSLLAGSVRRGSIYAWVAVGTSRNWPARPIGNWQTVGWPVAITLPRADRFFGGEVPVSGNLLVEGGRTPVVGLICGVGVGVASGFVDLLPTENSFWTRRDRGTQTYGAADVGKVEYSYDPPWLVDVADRLLHEQIYRP